MEIDSQHLLLTINGCTYAVRVPYVRKIVELPSVSSVPRAKPYILGVTKADGEVYTVVDLRVLLGAEPKEFPRWKMAVLLAYGESKICAVVDNVLSVTAIDSGSAIYPLQKKCCAYGVVRIDGEIIFLLSMEDLIMREKI